MKRNFVFAILIPLVIGFSVPLALRPFIEDGMTRLALSLVIIIALVTALFLVENKFPKRTAPEALPNKS